MLRTSAVCVKFLTPCLMFACLGGGACGRILTFQKSSDQEMSVAPGALYYSDEGFPIDGFIFPSDDYGDYGDISSEISTYISGTIHRSYRGPGLQDIVTPLSSTMSWVTKFLVNLIDRSYSDRSHASSAQQMQLIFISEDPDPLDAPDEDMWQRQDARNEGTPDLQTMGDVIVMGFERRADMLDFEMEGKYEREQREELAAKDAEDSAATNQAEPQSLLSATFADGVRSESSVTALERLRGGSDIGDSTLAVPPWASDYSYTDDDSEKFRSAFALGFYDAASDLHGHSSELGDAVESLLTRLDSMNHGGVLTFHGGLSDNAYNASPFSSQDGSELPYKGDAVFIPCAGIDVGLRLLELFHLCLVLFFCAAAIFAVGSVLRVYWQQQDHVILPVMFNQDGRMVRGHAWVRRADLKPEDLEEDNVVHFHDINYDVHSFRDMGPGSACDKKGMAE